MDRGEKGISKPTAELSDEGLPIPPEDPEQYSGEYVDLLRWVQDWMNTPWGAALGGAVLFYLIRLWMEYIESQQAVNDPFHNWPTFVAQANTQDYGFESLLKVAKNPMQMTTQELSKLL